MGHRSKSSAHRFIVTGGAGFIGSNLVRALNERGHEDIIVVDQLNHPAKLRNLDRLRFTDFYDKAAFRTMLQEELVPKVDCMFHVGACSSTLVTDEAYLTDNNYRYSVEMCEWAMRVGARFIYASSAATYGDGSLGYGDDDDQVTRALRPLNAYGRSKQMFDLWALDHGLFDRIAGLKYFNVYGPGEDHKGEMRSMVLKAHGQIESDGIVRLFQSHRPEYRDGEQVRDFVYVADAVAVTLFFWDHPEVSGLYNCGTGRARSWIDLARALYAAVGKEPRIEYVPMPPELRNSYQYHTQADMAKLRQVGYAAPFIDIEEGVARYVRDCLAAAPKP
jgi:ADP-L-glycero-D-manno-heptose 6-epimerase